MPMQIPLTEELVSHFLNFHDCEIQGFSGSRNPLEFSLDIEVKRNSLEYYKSISSSGQNLVRIVFHDIELIRISDFNHQNAILNLSLVRVAELFRVSIRASFGLEGEIEAHEVGLQLL